MISCYTLNIEWLTIVLKGVSCLYMRMYLKMRQIGETYGLGRQGVLLMR